MRIASTESTQTELIVCAWVFFFLFCAVGFSESNSMHRDEKTVLDGGVVIRCRCVESKIMLYYVRFRLESHFDFALGKKKKR